MSREKLDKWLERGILALVLAIMVFAPLATGAVRMQDFLIVQGLAIGAMLLWAVRVWVSPKTQLLWPPLTWVVLAFTAYAIVRYFTADVEYVARTELIRIVIYAFLFLVIVNNLHRQESTQVICFTMIFLAMGISCYAIYQFVTGSDRVWTFVSPYPGRGGGTYICPNHLAGFLEMLLPLALAYTLIGRAKPLTKVLVGYSALVMLAGLGATVSRAGWAACGLSLIVFFGVLATQRGRRLPALLMLAVLMIGGFYFFSKVNPLERRFQDSAAESLDEIELRYELWDSAVRMWRDHLWFGIGPGHYDARFREYRPIKIQRQPDRAHNEYINLLTDWGVIGGVIVAAGLVVLVLGLIRAGRSVRRAREFGSGLSNKFAFVLGASIGLLALLLHSFFDFNMHIPANAILALALAALLASHLRFATERYWTTAHLWMKLVLTLVLLAGTTFLTWQEFRLAREVFWLNQAKTKPPFSPAQVEALEKAFAAEPKNFDTTYAIGEALRIQSFQGNDNYADLAKKAMEWYSLGMELNPYDGYNYLRFGMCLDWLGRYAESREYIMRATELDPNGYFTAMEIGWHYMENGDFAAARTWLHRSVILQSDRNQTAWHRMLTADRRLRQEAAKARSMATAEGPVNNFGE